MDSDAATLVHDGTNELPLGSDDGVVEPTGNRDDKINHRSLGDGGKGGYYSNILVTRVDALKGMLLTHTIVRKST